MQGLRIVFGGVEVEREPSPCRTRRSVPADDSERPFVGGRCDGIPSVRESRRPTGRSLAPARLGVDRRHLSHTVRQLHDGLPADQRLAIWRFYWIGDGCCVFRRSYRFRLLDAGGQTTAGYVRPDRRFSGKFRAAAAWAVADCRRTRRATRSKLEATEPVNWTGIVVSSYVRRRTVHCAVSGIIVGHFGCD